MCGGMHSDQGFNALAVGQRQIEENDIDEGLAQTSDSRIETADVRKGELSIAGLCKELTHQANVARIVFDQQDMDRPVGHTAPG